MKKIAFLLCSFVLVIACTKDKNSPQNSSIQYQVNGTQIEIDGGMDTTQRNLATGSFYGCYVTKSQASNFYIISGEGPTGSILLALNTSGQLQTKTYREGEASVSLAVNQVPYGVLDPDDSITVTINRYSNGTIDGAFSGALTDLNEDKIVVTNGHLNNLKIY
ncbi:MAG TPA: hypothetical protein VG890_17200 [Puia sp.]|nr:hypothetical protein [Puia sp.]